MREVTGAIIAIELVLCSVFVPVAFLGGLAGKLYQQFAVTVATAVVISGVVALTLTPALCALLLKRRTVNRACSARSTRVSRFARSYLRRRRWDCDACSRRCDVRARHRRRRAAVQARARSLVPPEDQGYLFGAVVLPDGATLRAPAGGSAMQKVLAENPAVEHVFMINGFDLIGGGNKTNSATLFITLKPWDERAQRRRRRQVRAAKGAARSPKASVFAFNPVPIRGLGHRRRLGDVRPGPRRRRPEQAQRRRAAIRRRLAQATRSRRHQYLLPPDGAADARRGRSREGRRAGRAGQRPLRRAAKHDGRALRQRLQQVRPHLPGADPGGRRVPRAARGSRQRLRALVHDGRDDAGEEHARRSRASSDRSRSIATTAFSPPRSSAATRRR